VPDPWLTIVRRNRTTNKTGKHDHGDVTIQGVLDEAAPATENFGEKIADRIHDDTAATAASGRGSERHRGRRRGHG
jgi:hypothetical protein